MSSVRIERNLTILEVFFIFSRTKRISHLFEFFHLIMQKKRLFEFSYGAFCFLVMKPNKVYSDKKFDIVKGLEKAKILFAEVDTQKKKILLAASSQLNSNELPLETTIHGFTLTDNGFIVGEYAQNSSRILVKKNEGIITHQLYESNSGVRHIHSILQHDGYAFISTGDTNKYLDRYRIVNGDLCFDSRVLCHLGGFLSCCVVDGMCFFGTDFSERPNYIFSLKTRRKYSFPRPAYTQYCVLMLPLYESYILCLNRTSRIISDRKTISIFDVKSSSFIYCKEYQEVGGGGGIFGPRVDDQLL